MMQRLFVFVFMLAATVASAVEDNSIVESSDARIDSKDELVATVIMNCFGGEQSTMNCVRGNVLRYLDTVIPQVEEKRLTGGDDEKIFNRIQRYINSNEFNLQLPELFFQEATLSFKPGKGLGDFDISFPPPPKEEGRALTEAKNEMRAKGVLPLLLLLKLKLKALTPIMVALIGMKALKALVLSKIAIVLVVGFLVVQLCKKSGMMMPMSMMPPPMDPATPLPYGAPAAPAPPVTMSSYEPSWEPSGGPYARVGDAHPLAYNGYAPPAAQTTHH